MASPPLGCVLLFLLFALCRVQMSQGSCDITNPDGCDNGRIMIGNMGSGPIVYADIAPIKLANGGPNDLGDNGRRDSLSDSIMGTNDLEFQLVAGDIFTVTTHNDASLVRHTADGDILVGSPEEENDSLTLSSVFQAIGHVYVAYVNMWRTYFHDKRNDTCSEDIQWFYYFLETFAPLFNLVCVIGFWCYVIRAGARRLWNWRSLHA